MVHTFLEWTSFPPTSTSKKPVTFGVLIPVYRVTHSVSTHQVKVVIYSKLKRPTVIKGKLLLWSYEQIWVVQYGEISRWSLVGVLTTKAFSTTDSLSVIQSFSLWQVGRIKVMGTWTLWVGWRWGEGGEIDLYIVPTTSTLELNSFLSSSASLLYCNKGEYRNEHIGQSC